MQTDTLIAVLGALVTIEGTIIGGVWMLSTRIGDLRSDISELKAHRDAHADGISTASARIDALSAEITRQGERLAVVEDRTRDR